MAGVTGRFWNGKRVFLTGHTGFKGVWLSLWLQQMGAIVSGYSRNRRRNGAEAIVSMQSFQGDVRDTEALQKAMQTARPDIVFHMAAQPLVRRASRDPIETYSTNVMGTATLMNAIRQCEQVRAVIVLTTDKCYERRSGDWAYREIDRLGGEDPYSSSKACMELVVAAFRDSYLSDRSRGHGVGVATARTGNVIGGGDWAEDRLIPDLVRSFAAGKLVSLRNPQEARPWQFILETLRGYLLLAQHLYQDGAGYSGAWNFGPLANDIRPVHWIVEKLASAWGAEARWNIQPDNLPQEMQTLRLDCSKAALELGWRPMLSLATALEMTADWYRDFYAGMDIRTKYLKQIATYSARADADVPEILPQSTSRK